MVFCDLALSRRLERAEACSNARFIECRARLDPALGAEWIEVGGAYALYDGPRSPCTQTFGLGLWQMPASQDFEKLESFFTARGAPVLHEVSPMADAELLPALVERGYRPMELSSVMFLPLLTRDQTQAEGTDAIPVTITTPGEAGLWARTATEGWRDFAEIADLMFDLMRVFASKTDAHTFLVELAGQPIAAGALSIHDGVALLAGASTIPEWRGRGVQRALLKARLDFAAKADCDLAMMGAAPGSRSQRNAERNGFRMAYTRIKWGRP